MPTGGGLLAGGRRFGEVHALEEGLEAGVGAEGSGRGSGAGPGEGSPYGSVSATSSAACPRAPIAMTMYCLPSTM